jgi:hypothetical protein
MGGDCFKFANKAAGIGMAAHDGLPQVTAQASAYAGRRPAEMRRALTYWPQRVAHRRRRLLAGDMCTRVQVQGLACRMHTHAHARSAPTGVTAASTPISGSLTKKGRGGA